ncbi:hypothetical protein JJB09_23680 [Rhizobium sp. KVB221]|uniref:O-antigen ligase domain-containing protein n=1 Tax=Rhizobium setariae TaxID=2801340 RepID=A0A937CN34_9HYPH|nr:hypothetical protein [Rhizobium setariae]MBL0375020.1 hypothetical protein [Rhizobium setariae]
MAVLPDETPVPGLMTRLSRMDRFGLFLAGFILAYAAASFALEHVLGVIGFAKAPYLNAITYLYALGFIVLGIAFNKVDLGFAMPHPLGALMLAVLFISAVIGISNGNASQYIVGWSLYIVTGVLAFQFFRHPKGIEVTASGTVATLFSPAFLLLVLLFAFLSIFNKDNHYQYVLFEVIAIYAVLLRPRIIEKALGAAIYLCIHLGSNDGFVQVEINRASILAVGAIGFLWLLYRRHLVVLFFVIFAAIGGLLYALSLDDQVVEDLPRNIKEAILLMKGDDIYNHISSYQRVYEGQKVMEDFQAASDTEWLFGKGLGRTVDMTGAADKTPGQHALLGATEVHNVHFLHFAVFHKFGLAGLGLLVVFGAGLIWMFAVDLAGGRMSDATLFFYFYLFYNFVFAFPASNFLIANPLWPAFLGLLCKIRSAPATSPALTEFARPL